MPPGATRVRRWGKSPRRADCSACPEPRAGSTTIRWASQVAFAGREAELPEQPRHVPGVGLGRGVPPPGLRVELRLGDRPPGEEAAVPEVVRLEWAAQPLLDERGHLRRERRGDDGLEQGAEPRLRDLVVELEPPVHLGRGERRVLVRAPCGLEVPEKERIPGVRLAVGADRQRRHTLAGLRRRTRLDLCRRRHRDHVAHRVPVQARIVDHRPGNLLGHDALHGCADEPLALEAC